MLYSFSIYNKQSIRAAQGAVNSCIFHDLMFVQRAHADQPDLNNYLQKNTHRSQQFWKHHYDFTEWTENRFWRHIMKRKWVKACYWDKASIASERTFGTELRPVSARSFTHGRKTPKPAVYHRSPLQNEHSSMPHSTPPPPSFFKLKKFDVWSKKKFNRSYFVANLTIGLLTVSPAATIACTLYCCCRTTIKHCFPVKERRKLYKCTDYWVLHTEYFQTDCFLMHFVKVFCMVLDVFAKFWLPCIILYSTVLCCVVLYWVC